MSVALPGASLSIVRLQPVLDPLSAKMAPCKVFVAFLWFVLIVSAEEAPDGNVDTTSLKEEVQVDSCASGGGSCEESPPQVCGEEFCAARPFYHRDSGSAQSYKPNAPIKTLVCESTGRRYRVAMWPFTRHSRGKPPMLRFQVQLWGCNGQQEGSSSCCCTPLPSAKLEVWQAKPDGNYASLSNDKEDGNCRATIPLMEENATGTFDTIAPGSTGILGGLGPRGWDFWPYGPPLMHFLATAPGYDPLLVQLPVLMDRKLNQKRFLGPDWRGPAYVLSRSASTTTTTSAMEVKQWEVQGHPNKVHVEMNLYLLASPQDTTANVNKAMCPSTLYGLPSSFFVEPIAVCAPSLLNFFRM